MTVLSIIFNNTNEKDFRRFGSVLTLLQTHKSGAAHYKKLWHILTNRNFIKKYLEELARLSHYEITNLSLGEM